MINKTLPILFLFILFSCAEDCSECEKNLKECMTYEPVALELPTPEPEEMEVSEASLTVEVTAEDKYVFEETDYPFDEVKDIIIEKMDELDPDDRKIKIAGDKMAHYEAVYNVISLAGEHNWNTILVYSN